MLKTVYGNNGKSINGIWFMNAGDFAAGDKREACGVGVEYQIPENRIHSKKIIGYCLENSDYPAKWEITFDGELFTTTKSHHPNLCYRIEKKEDLQTAIDFYHNSKQVETTNQKTPRCLVDPFTLSEIRITGPNHDSIEYLSNGIKWFEDNLKDGYGLRCGVDIVWHSNLGPNTLFAIRFGIYRDLIKLYAPISATEGAITASERLQYYGTYLNVVFRTPTVVEVNNGTNIIRIYAFQKNDKLWIGGNLTYGQLIMK